MMKTFAELNFPGRLIAVEGLDGSGKSTQIYLLKRWLEAEGIKVYFSEWNSSELVKSATSKGKKRELLTPTTFSLIHATDFADRYERHLLPLLRAGYVVLCDRYIFTAFARDVTRGCPPDWVRGIYNFAALPDLMFFFKADLEVSLNRILEGRPKLKFFEAGMDLRLSSDPYESFRIFQGRILEQYMAMSGEFNFMVMDANQNVEKQQALVRKLVGERIDLARFRRRSPLPLPPPHPAGQQGRRKPRRIRPHEKTDDQSRRRQKGPPLLRAWHSPLPAGRPGGQIDRGRGRGRFGPFHADCAAGGLAGNLRPRDGAGGLETLHAGQFRTGKGAGRKHFEPDDVELVLRDRLCRPVGKHHFARAQGRVSSCCRTATFTRSWRATWCAAWTRRG